MTKLTQHENEMIAKLAPNLVAAIESMDAELDDLKSKLKAAKENELVLAGVVASIEPEFNVTFKTVICYLCKENEDSGNVRHKPDCPVLLAEKIIKENKP